VRHDLILDALPDAVIAVDAGGRVLFANAAAADLWRLSSAAELTGLSVQALIQRFDITDQEGRPVALGDLPLGGALSGPPLDKLVRLRPAGADETIAGLASEAAEAPGAASETESAQPSTSDRWVHIQARSVPGAGDQAPYTVSVFRDVTRLRGETQDVLRSRDDLMAIVSHDLRNPLGVVLTSSALLLRAELPTDKGERARRQVEAIQRAGNRMNRLIKDLLDLASIQGGQLVLTRRTHDVGSLMTDSVESLQPLALQKSQRLQAEPLGQSLAVHCDRERVIQVFAHVVGNAIKFSGEGGEIRVSVAADGAVVCFTVTDNGPGMTPEELQNMYDRYWQAKRRNREGIGLGLSLTKGIVEGHGGRVWAESAIGTGTTVHFTLPSTLSAALPA
jgi:signal transduction histidine kinase